MKQACILAAAPCKSGRRWGQQERDTDKSHCCCRQATKQPARLQQLYTSDTETEPLDLHAESEEDEALLAPALGRAARRGQQQGSQQPAGTDDDTEHDAKSAASGQEAARAGGSQKRKLPVVEGQDA